MTILITGGTGYVGGALIQALLKEGYKVKAPSRTLPAGEDNALWVPMPGVAAPEEQFEKLVDGVEHVVHCAWASSSQASRHDGEFEESIELTCRLARMAQRTVPGKFLFLSSIRASVDPGDSAYLSADHTDRPSTSYGRSKLAAERELEAIYATHPERLVVLRLPPVYGRGMKGTLAQLLGLARLRIPLPTAGWTGRRSIIGLERVAGAALQLLRSPLPSARPLYAADANPVAISEIIRAFRRGLGRQNHQFAFSDTGMALAAALLRRKDFLKAVQVDQACDLRPIQATGWLPAADTLERLAALARHPD